MSELNLYFHFLGYGNIAKADVWFIGAEPGGPLTKFHNDQEKIRIDGEELMYDPNIPKVREGETESRSWTCPREIMSGVVGRGPNYFLSNMAPIPRPKMKQEHQLIAEDEYIRKVRDEYIPRIMRARAQFEPKAIVFHGTTALERYDIATFFGLSSESLTETYERVKVYEGERIITTGHFSDGRHFNNSEKAFVASKLSAWLS